MTEKENLECEHENSMVFVKKEMSNGVFMLKKQCSFCGHVDTQNLKHSLVKDINKVKDLDEFLADMRDSYKESERRRLWEEGKTEKQKEWEKQQKKNKIAYDKYLISKEWRIRRDKIFERDSGRCVLCHKQGHHVHHMTYRNIFNEDKRDLITVCTECHEYIHGRVFENNKEINNDEKVYF